MACHVGLESLNVESFGIVNRSVELNHANDLGSEFLKEVCSMVSNVTEPLHNHRLSFEAGGDSNPLAFIGKTEEIFCGIANTESSSFRTTIDTSQRDGFASHAGVGVNILHAIQDGEGVTDPRHLSGSCSNIRCWHINSWSEEAIFLQFDGISSGNLLELNHRVFLGIDCNPSLGSTEGHIDDSALKRHQRRQGFNLLQVDVRSIANASLARSPVMAVLRTVTADHVDFPVIPPDGERDSQDGVASENLFEHAFMHVGVLGCFVEVDLHHVQESRFRSFIARRKTPCIAEVGISQQRSKHPMP
mmetsp:Transcript_18331/g.41734  ORF Transcript_18331/g.41734 Transcript_18331/m.41734 type:complete len:303 (+) Transcript_18331:1358-2266(+)